MSIVRKGKPSWTMPNFTVALPCDNILHASSGYPISMNERLLIDVVHSKPAVPVSARTCRRHDSVSNEPIALTVHPIDLS
jgi:hypothetical protein